MSVTSVGKLFCMLIDVVLASVVVVVYFHHCSEMYNKCHTSPTALLSNVLIKKKGFLRVIAVKTLAVCDLNVSSYIILN